MPATIKYSIEDVRAKIESRGWTLITEVYKNVKSHLNIICNNKHNITITFHSILEGRGCRICSAKLRGEKSRIPAEKVKKECLGKGFEILGDYTTIRTPVKTKCVKHDIIWMATPDHLIHGQGCQKCGDDKKRNHLSPGYEFVQNYMKNLGGELLSKEYINGLTPIRVRCSKGHETVARFSDIKRDKWCPECSIGKSQKLVIKIIRDIFKDKSVICDFREFSWLKTNAGGKLEIDIYIPELKLAIEYDGKQHFRPVQFGGISLERAKQNLKLQKRRDKLKNKKIAQHPEDVQYFIRIKYDDPFEDPDYIKNLLMSHGITL